MDEIPNEIIKYILEYVCGISYKANVYLRDIVHLRYVSKRIKAAFDTTTAIWREFGARYGSKLTISTFDDFAKARDKFPVMLKYTPYKISTDPLKPSYYYGITIGATRALFSRMIARRELCNCFATTGAFTRDAAALIRLNIRMADPNHIGNLFVNIYPTIPNPTVFVKSKVCSYMEPLIIAYEGAGPHVLTIENGSRGFGIDGDIMSEWDDIQQQEEFSVSISSDSCAIIVDTLI